jgi:hypothetical protein
MNENQLGTFFLGIVAAVAIYFLWKKESQAGGFLAGSGAGAGSPAGYGAGAGCNGGCDSCSGAFGGCVPDAGVAPTFQAAMQDAGLAGTISPGTPPLGSVPAGGAVTSFYAPSGGTPDSTFTFAKSAPVAGSPTTPAATTPVRSTAPVGQYADNAFVQRYNVTGVPLSYRLGTRMVN